MLYCIQLRAEFLCSFWEFIHFFALIKEAFRCSSLYLCFLERTSADRFFKSQFQHSSELLHGAQPIDTLQLHWCNTCHSHQIKEIVSRSLSFYVATINKKVVKFHCPFLQQIGRHLYGLLFSNINGIVLLYDNLPNAI